MVHQLDLPVLRLDTHPRRNTTMLQLSLRRLLVRDWELVWARRGRMSARVPGISIRGFMFVLSPVFWTMSVLWMMAN